MLNMFVELCIYSLRAACLTACWTFQVGTCLFCIPASLVTYGFWWGLDNYLKLVRSNSCSSCVILADWQILMPFFFLNNPILYTLHRMKWGGGQINFQYWLSWSCSSRWNLQCSADFFNYWELKTRYWNFAPSVIHWKRYYSIRSTMSVFVTACVYSLTIHTSTLKKKNIQHPRNQIPTFVIRFQKNLWQFQIIAYHVKCLTYPWQSFRIW